MLLCKCCHTHGMDYVRVCTWTEYLQKAALNPNDWKRNVIFHFTADNITYWWGVLLAETLQNTVVPASDKAVRGLKRSLHF